MAQREFDHCAVDGCERVVVHISGYCRKHHTVNTLYGDPLHFGLVDELTKRQKFTQEALRSNTDECICSPFSRSAGGYAGIMYYDGQQVVICRFICELVHGSPPSKIHEAHHICGNGHLGCINWKHLSWKTPLEHAKDRRPQRKWRYSKRKEIGGKGY
jgi:hypothetical protein